MPHYTVKDKATGAIKGIFEAGNVAAVRSHAIEEFFSVGRATPQELIDADKASIVKLAPVKAASAKPADPARTDIEDQIKQAEQDAQEGAGEAEREQSEGLVTE